MPAWSKNVAAASNMAAPLITQPASRFTLKNSVFFDVLNTWLGVAGRQPPVGLFRPTCHTCPTPPLRSSQISVQKEKKRRILKLSGEGVTAVNSKNSWEDSVTGVIQDPPLCTFINTNDSRWIGIRETPRTWNRSWCCPCEMKANHYTTDMMEVTLQREIWWNTSDKYYSWDSEEHDYYLHHPEVRCHIIKAPFILKWFLTQACISMFSLTAIQLILNTYMVLFPFNFVLAEFFWIAIKNLGIPSLFNIVLRFVSSPRYQSSHEASAAHQPA